MEDPRYNSMRIAMAKVLIAVAVVWIVTSGATYGALFMLVLAWWFIHCIDLENTGDL